MYILLFVDWATTFFFVFTLFIYFFHKRNIIYIYAQYKVRITFKERQINARAYCMIVGIEPHHQSLVHSSHFTLDPLRHKLDARTRANKSRALTNAHVSAYNFSHLAAMLVATCFKRGSATTFLHFTLSRCITFVIICVHIQLQQTSLL